MKRRATRFTPFLAVGCLSIAACGQSDDVTGPDAAPATAEPTSTAATTAATSSVTTVSPGVSVTTTEEPADQVTGLTTPGGVDVEQVPFPQPRPDAGSVPLCDDLGAITTDLVGNGSRMDEVFIRLVNQYGAQRPDVFGGLIFDRQAGGVALIGFTDDPESHRDAIEALTVDDLADLDEGSAGQFGPDGPLGEREFPWDVIQVQYSEVALTGLLGSIFEQARRWPIEVVSASNSIELQRVSLDLAEPTDGALAELAGLVDASVVCVNGPLLDPDRIVFEPGDDLDVIVQPDADGDFADGLRVGCASDVSYPLANVLDPTTLVDAGRDDLLDGIERTIVDGGIELDDPAAPLDRWVLLEESDDEALVYNPEGSSLRQLTLEMTAAGWSFNSSSSGGGDCELLVELPDGLGGVEWTIDPTRPTDPTSTAIEVLATEQACTGSSEMGERLLGPQVVETDTEVLISFAAIPLKGPQTCPGNPSTPVTIELDEPLGSRALREGRSTGFTLDELLAR